MININRDSIEQILNNSEYSKTAYNKLETMYEYTSCVMRFENRMRMIEATSFDTEDYQDKVKNLDKNRKLKHDAAISSLSVLNRIADRIDIEPVYPGKTDVDLEYRGDIASSIFEFCKENLDLDKYGVIGKNKV